MVSHEIRKLICALGQTLNHNLGYQATYRLWDAVMGTAHSCAARPINGTHSLSISISRETPGNGWMPTSQGT